jgi:aryl-alcohol dehydrogenase-like predicted oxidoreductase
VKLILGSAQFGMNYGISNLKGKTSHKEVNKIIDEAYSLGVKIIETAALYGDSEKVIGECINGIIDWQIVTKTPHFPDENINYSHIKILNHSFQKSLDNLKRKTIYGLLLHSCDDLFKAGGELLFKEMEKIKSNGLVKKIGVSVYDSKQIDLVLKKYRIDLIQLPVNILDQELIERKYLDLLKEKEIEIHARSIFLQGLLLMQKELIPPYFSPIEKNLNSFYSLSKELSLSQLELALGFVTNLDEIDKVVVGVNSASQLQEIIQAKQAKIDHLDFKNISVYNKNYTNPSLWKI